MEGAPADLNVVRNFVFNSVLDLHQTPSKICQRLSEGRVQVRTWGRVKELVFRCAGVALVRDRDEGVKNTFEGRERTRPTMGEGLAVNRQSGLLQSTVGGETCSRELRLPARKCLPYYRGRP